MPRKKGVPKAYTEEDVIRAIADIKNGLSLNTTARKYNIPTSTLTDKVKQKYTIGKSRPGK